MPQASVGPAPRSRPVLAVHLNLPGAWDGYREVGRIYSDQMLFTLGRHWLDNFHHPALREPGMYRLQQYPDGSLVHTISPELQHRYLVRSDQVEGGASVLTIAEWGGAPVAYLVLAVIDTPSVDTVAVLVPGASEAADEDLGQPRATAPPAPPQEVLPAAPSMGHSAATPRRTLSNDKHTRTIVPGAIAARIFTLQERGASKAYAQVWAAFKQQFGLTEYKNLPQGRFSDALDWLGRWGRAVLFSSKPVPPDKG